MALEPATRLAGPISTSGIRQYGTDGRLLALTMRCESLRLRACMGFGTAGRPLRLMLTLQCVVCVVNSANRVDVSDRCGSPAGRLMQTIWTGKLALVSTYLRLTKLTNALEIQKSKGYNRFL
jgi:hypothetical protein